MLDGDILSLDPSKLAQLLPERLQADRATGSSGILQETYAGDFPCLLRLGGNAKRTEHGGKDKDSDFFLHAALLTRPSSHLITLFALASTSGGIVRRICFAAFRLITNSNFVGRSTGRSAGLAPLRILSMREGDRFGCAAPAAALGLTP